MRVDYIYEGSQSRVDDVAWFEKGGEEYLIKLEDGDSLIADEILKAVNGGEDT